MAGRDLDAARTIVSKAELEALEAAEELRVEAQAVLEDARAEAARILDEGHREAERARMMREELLLGMRALRDALVRADGSLEAFLQAAG